ncbi:hypothetical protein VKT23_008707 [Stygiomarasmius scandens]|uniref:KOW domain-containing protein n=1 Tax=Marasmiellus scandens TaxID=2682957 RepID=A0ABR1JLH4_9AGAR
MVFRNPFLDLQAYGSDDESSVASDGESAAGGDDQEDGQWRADDANGVEWEDEDTPVDDSNRITGATFLDDLERRYAPGNPPNLRYNSPILRPSSDDFLDKPELHRDLLAKAVLMSERKRLFWKMKCRPGQETQVVFDIMQNLLPSALLTAQRCIDVFASSSDGSVEELVNNLRVILDLDSIPDTLKAAIDHAVARKSERQQSSSHQLPIEPNDRVVADSPHQRAYEYLLSFAGPDSITILQAEAELQGILGMDTLPQLWSTAIGKAVVAPGVDSPLPALYAMKNKLVPSNLLSSVVAAPALRQTSSTSPTPISVTSNPSPVYARSSDVYRVFSAFSIPDVPGCVYLEAYLGKNPQNTPVIEFLRHHPAIVKVGSVRLDRTSGHHHQQVWLRAIPAPEVGDLLSLTPPSINLFSWVKVTRGRYKNEVGLVIRREIATAHRRLAVLFVPRLEREPPTVSTPPSTSHSLTRVEDLSNDSELQGATETHQPEKVLGKRKRNRHSKPLRLFSKNEWAEGKGKGEWTELGPNRYRMDGEEFEYDLLLCHLSYTAVSDVDVCIDPSTRLLFKASLHPILQSVRLPLPDNWVFFQNESVEVILSAPLTEQQKLDHSLPRAIHRKNGRIERIESERCLVHLDDYNDDIPEQYTTEAYGVKNLKRTDTEETDIWVSKLNLRKQISVGDHVEVVSGDMKRRLGFVVNRLGQQVSIIEMMRDIFTVHVNSCRIVKSRNDTTVPWIDRHITVIRGSHRGYTGIVADVCPPSMNSYTMLDIRLFGWGETVRLRHDDVVDTCSNQSLYRAFPLLPHQQGFQQASWSTAYAPNMTSPAILDGCILTAEEAMFRQQRPAEPWLGKPVVVIKGANKNKGFVKSVELFHRLKSGMRVLVEFDYISAEHGANPRSWVDYGNIRDPQTGLPLHIRHPLSKHEQRYWSPLTRIRAVSVSGPSGPAPPRFRPLLPPSHTNTPIGNVLEGADPFHWSVDNRLDGKSFLAFYKPLDLSGKSEKEVIATPNSTLGFVSCTINGREHWRALPQEIFLPADPARPIKAQYNTKPLLVVRGEYAGKHVRQIYFKSQKGTAERLITASVFEPWGEVNEERKEEHVVVRSEDCAFVPNDPNKEKWEELMKSLRSVASKKRQR